MVRVSVGLDQGHLRFLIVEDEFDVVEFNHSASSPSLSRSASNEAL